MVLDRTGQMCHAKSSEQILQLCNQRNIHITMLVDRILFEGPSREEVQVQARGLLLLRPFCSTLAHVH